ncbi:hypothetical protein C4J81_08235 [Deltaproteobacteria bacterium Smac51]|nr:hypothetical protein C4J81_08235 [Deltaproteobacteria bacterium Smac51]
MLNIPKILKSIRPVAWIAIMVCALTLAFVPTAAADDEKSLGGKPKPGDVKAALAPSGLKFDVEVKTGSGSTTNPAHAMAVPADQPPAEEMKIEVIDVTHGSGSVASAPADSSAAQQTEMIPAASVAQAPPTPPAEAAAPAAASSTAPLPPLRSEAPVAVESVVDEAVSPEQKALFEALEQWHKENLANYNYNIARLYDPFMPIKEVRGKPEEEGDQIDPDEEAKLPPILRLELSQLKLVAITSISGRGGSALASFEDGVGSSYILRQGDRIGRRNGRIISIEPTQVTVEEPPRGSAGEPKVTVIKLNVLDMSSGFTYSGR